MPTRRAFEPHGIRIEERIIHWFCHWKDSILDHTYRYSGIKDADGEIMVAKNRPLLGKDAARHIFA